MPFTFKETPLQGLMIAEARRFPDDRGFFMETYKHSDFAAHGIDQNFVQDNHSLSSRGVLRGLHFQKGAYAQGKLVRVISGRVWDVAVDIRRESPTFLKWFGIEISADNCLMFYLPPGFAHGFVTLEDNTQFLYKCTAEYHKASEAGIRWDDPAIGIDWPLKDGILVSDKDAILPTSDKFDFRTV
ncbi:MAG TPA: dTDP-4-dehydrorhamnose 3,5-epimerase [Spirochaetota bacterium]|nr:dTDP-4-dehydrorhamnose 3,5-epimerase [Spirochaetota bacterium]